MEVVIPKVTLSSGRVMPMLGMGTASFPPVGPEDAKAAILNAIKIGYRHFDTASAYQSEEFFGEAIAEALQLGLIQSRDELFITSKLWCTDAHPDIVVPALQNSLRNLKLEYLGLYLIHFPVSLKPGKYEFPVKKENLIPMDYKSSIGVSNFSCKKLQTILDTANISPTVNQVCLRWVYEQGVSFLVKSFNEQRMKENLMIFDWELTRDDLIKIRKIPQRRGLPGDLFTSRGGRMEKVMPAVTLSSGSVMPVLGMGTAAYPLVDSEEGKLAILNAIKTGYRHFDTASVYQFEEVLGEAIAEALQLGLIKSRDELFITSKLWPCDAHPDLVVPALRNSLRNLKLGYLDLYLIHFPISAKPAVGLVFPLPKDALLTMDYKSVWEAMEECQKLGLTKSIGVSNFSCKKLQTILDIANIPPAVNQVEMNPVWQNLQLRDFCKDKSIILTAYSPLEGKGTPWGSNAVYGAQVLHEIAEAKGKTHAQVCLRWVYEQGVSLLVKSFNDQRMKENMMIFDWELTEDELEKIGKIPQSRGLPGDVFVSELEAAPFKTVEEFWDGEV
ncbi:hypothetical protein MKX03_001855 [Papaver bracteatum]|nr:hypothetical protein MKX03_001855 [Papaver bracteatum]